MARIDWERFERGSHKLSEETRVRLARPADQEFVDSMADAAGAHGSGGMLDHPHFQQAVRAGLRSRGGYWREILNVYNSAIGNMKASNPIVDTITAASFCLVACRNDKTPIGSLSVGAGTTLILQMLEQVHPRQAISLMAGLPKLKAIAVAHEYRGQGVGTQLLNFLQLMVSRLGYVGLFGDVEDSAQLVEFYETHGFHVLPPDQMLNIWPVAGGHVVNLPTAPEAGPFIKSEADGMRVMFSVAGHETRTENEMLSLNLHPLS